jgi:hypothetical protein
MKFFIIACCFCFLAVVLFLDVWKYFSRTRHPEYYTGLKVVPILMVAKIFLGIYYNLSVGINLPTATLPGPGSPLAEQLLYFCLTAFIPVWGYMALLCIITILCYGFMMVTSYALGQKHYPVPYAKKNSSPILLLHFTLWRTPGILVAGSKCLDKSSGRIVADGFIYFVYS